MSLIHIARNNTVLGQYTEAEVRAGLSSGAFLTTDLAWRAGKKDWAPLGAWPEFADAPPPVGVVPPALSGDHMIPQPPPVAAVELPPAPAWECSGAAGAAGRYFESVKAILVKPTETFAALPQDGPIARALGFYAVALVATALVCGVSQVMTAKSIPSESIAELQKTLPQWAGLLRQAQESSGLAIFAASTLLVLAGTILYRAIYWPLLHYCLKICGAGDAPLSRTVRPLAYVEGAVGIAGLPFALGGLIPVVGPMFGLGGLVLLVYSLVLSVIALMKVRRCGAGSAIGAYLLTLVFGCCLYALFSFVLVFTIMSAVGMPKPHP